MNKYQINTEGVFHSEHFGKITIVTISVTPTNFY